MYMNGYIDIDPSHLTQVRRKPTKGFKRFAEILTLGLLSEKEEQETFTAVAILQEINVALRSLNVTDVVRFTKDDVVIYDDEESRDPDDMKIVLQGLSRQSGPGQAVFESLALMLEHHLAEITLIIEIRIRRTHHVGGFPIQIAVNGLASEFQNQSSGQSLDDRLEQVFADEESYKATEAKLREQFDNFMSQLEWAVRQKMSIEDMRRNSFLKIVRPNGPNGPSRPETASAFAGNDTTPTASSYTDPVFQRYQSTSDSFAYCYLWSSMMHSHGTHVSDARIVDEQGSPLMTVGDAGFNAADSTALDPEIPFAESDASEFAEVDSDFSLDPNKSSGFFGDEASDGSSWLDSFSFGDGGGFDGGDSGGDGGASSCGGGCGGD